MSCSTQTGARPMGRSPISVPPPKRSWPSAPPRLMVKGQAPDQGASPRPMEAASSEAGRRSMRSHQGLGGRWRTSFTAQTPSATASMKLASPRLCRLRSAISGAGHAEEISTAPSVARLKEGSLRLAVSSATRKAAARTKRKMPTTSSKRRRRKTRVPAGTKAVVVWSVIAPPPCRPQVELTGGQHLDQPGQAFLDHLGLMHQSDADIGRAGIAALGIGPRHIGAGKDAQARLGPEALGGGLAVADVQPQEESPAGP